MVSEGDCQTKDLVHIMQTVNHYHVLYNLLEHKSFKPEIHINSPNLLATFSRGLDHTIIHIENQSGPKTLSANIAQLKAIQLLFANVSIPTHMKDIKLNKVESSVLKVSAYSETKVQIPSVHLIQFVIQLYAYIIFQTETPNIKVNISSLIKRFNQFLNDKDNDVEAMFKVDGLRINLHDLVSLSDATIIHFTYFFNSFLSGNYVKYIKRLLEPVIIEEGTTDYLKRLLTLEHESPSMPIEAKAEDTVNINQTPSRNSQRLNLLEYSKSKADMLLMPNVSYGVFDHQLTRIESKLLEDIEQQLLVSVICYLALVLSKTENSIKQLIVSPTESINTDILVSDTGVYWCRYDVQMPAHAALSIIQKHQTIYNPYEGCVKLRLSDYLLPLLKTNQSSMLSSLIQYSDEDIQLYRHKLTKECKLNQILTFKKLRFAYFSRLAYQTDPAFASLVFANTAFAKPTTLYYLSASHCDIARAFNHVTSNLTHSEMSSDITSFCGVPKSYDTQWVKTIFLNHFTKLQAFAKTENPTQSQIIEHHNQFVAHILLAFHLVAGIRESRDVVADHITMDLKAQLLYVSDKNVDAMNVSRVIPIPTSLLRQIEFYYRHLRSVTKQLTSDNHDIASVLVALSTKQHINHATFSFIINGKVLSPSTQLVFEFAEIPDDVHRNFLRHYLASNCPSDIAHYRQYLLGHIVSGAHIYSPYNITPINHLESLRQGLEDLLNQCGFSVFEVSHCRGKLKVFTPHPTEIWIPKKWLGRIEIRAKAFKVLRAYMDYAYLRRLCEPAMLYKSFGAIREDIDAHFTQLSDKRLHKAVNGMLDKWERYFNKVTNQIYRTRFSNAQKRLARNAPMQVFYAHNANAYKEMYQDFRKEVTLALDVDFLLSIACYQPYLFSTFMMSEVQVWNIESLNGVVVLSDETHTGIVVNSFSALLLLKQTSNLRVELANDTQQINCCFNLFKSYCSAHGVEMRKMNVMTTFAESMLEHDIYMHSAFTHYDMTDTQGSSNLNLIDKRRLLANIYPEYDSFKSLQCDTEHHNLERPISTLQQDKQLITAIIHAFSQNHVTTVNNSALLFSTLNKVLEIDISNEKDFQAHVDTFHPITRYLLIFTLSECNRQKNNGERLAKSTIASYLRIYKQLFAFVKTQDMAEWDIDQVEGMYAAIIMQYTRDNKDSVSPDLYRFHSRVFVDTHIEHLDWLYISQDTTLSNERLNNTTLISGAEYHRARQYLRRNIEFSEDEKVLHEGILILSTKAGLRRAETSHLEISSIDLKYWTVFIHSNGYFKTKSKNSNRQYHLAWLLNDDEKAKLQDMFAVCEPHVENKKGRSFLFLTNQASGQRIPLNRVFSNISNALRFATGVTHVRIHDCRRTFINMQYLLFSNAYTQPAIEQLLQVWFGSDDLDSLKLQGYQALTGRTVISHDEKIACGIAMSAGHHLETERESYVLCADLMAFSHIERYLIQHIGWSTWMQVAGLSNKQNKLPISKIIKRVIKQHGKVFNKMGKVPKEAIFVKRSAANILFDELYSLHQKICTLMQTNSCKADDNPLHHTLNLTPPHNHDIDMIYRVVSHLGLSKLSLQKYGNYSFPYHPLATRSIASFFYHQDFIALLNKSIAVKTNKIVDELFFGTRVNNKQQILTQPKFEERWKNWLDKLDIRYTVQKMEEKHNNIHMELSVFLIVNRYPKQDLMVIYLVALYWINLEV